MRENDMKKANKTLEDYDDGMLPEYDFTGKKGVRGKYYRGLQKGYSVHIHNEDGSVTVRRYGPLIRLDGDVADFFPDAESVNRALRSLMALLPQKQTSEKKATYKTQKRSRKKPPTKK